MKSTVEEKKIEITITKDPDAKHATPADIEENKTEMLKTKWKNKRQRKKEKAKMQDDSQNLEEVSPAKSNEVQNPEVEEPKLEPFWLQEWYLNYKNPKDGKDRVRPTCLSSKPFRHFKSWETLSRHRMVHHNSPVVFKDLDLETKRRTLMVEEARL